MAPLLFRAKPIPDGPSNFGAKVVRDRLLRTLR
jgi:hypothetical protein